MGRKMTVFFKNVNVIKSQRWKDSVLKEVNDMEHTDDHKSRFCMWMKTEFLKRHYWVS